MRGCLAVAVLLWLLVGAGTALAAERQDVSTLSENEIRALQQRLADAKCYSGAIDGRASEALKTAVAQCPDQRPQLRIETGFHTARITRIGVDAKCRLAATASDDKTLRLWSLPDGKPLRVLRGPIGAGDAGKVWATAVSPDGRFAAAGGWDAFDEVGGEPAVTIYDAASGAVVARLGGMPARVDHLAFSRDGRWLAASLRRTAGVRLIETSSWRVIAKDEVYGGGSYGAAFGPDGRLYTTFDDGKIRRYSPSPGFAKEAEISVGEGKQPYGIAVDPKGQRLAVGMDDRVGVNIYQAQSLKFLAAAETQSVDNDLISVAWRSDGAALFAGGRYKRNGKNPVLSFDRDGRLLGAQVLPPAENTIFALAACGDGAAVAAGDPAFGLLDEAGAPSLWKSHAVADLRAARGEAFTISPDARRLRFGLEYGGAQPVLFDLAKLTLREEAPIETDFLRPRIDGLPVTEWKNDDHPKFAGKPIALEDYETSRALAIAPKQAGFALGTEYRLRFFDAKGKERWEQPVPAIVWGVNVSADGRLTVAAYADGTIRWHRISDGQELLALFVNAKTKEWVVWTPSGYYAASPNGEDLIGWHLNRGWDQTADFFPASKFRDIYARPDIVAKVLDTLDEGEAIKAANTRRGVKATSATIAESLPPVLQILSPKDGDLAPQGEATVRYLIRSPSGLPVEGLEALVGGKERAATPPQRLGIDRATQKCLETTHGQGSGSAQGCEGRMTLYNLPYGESEVTLYARAGGKTSVFAKLRFKNPNETKNKVATKPRLYVLAIGVSHYDDSRYRLTFADKDALDFASTLMRQKGGALYEDVEQHALADADARSVREGFDWLTTHVTEKDVGVIFFAGHGAVDANQRFYLLARDSDPDRLAQTAIAREELFEALKKLKGSPVLFIDACHAGAGAYPASAVADYNSSSVAGGILAAFPRALIFVSSEGRQASREDPAWGNGAFTKALIEGLAPHGGQPAGARQHDGKITPSALDDYVSETVKSLTRDQTHEEQKPRMAKLMEAIEYFAEAK